MVSIFEYTDYRKYLSDFYEERKKVNPNFSYQYIAQKADFLNRGFVYNIIKGKKSLSKLNCFKISQALGHNKYESEYFENLVAFNKAKGLKERNYFFEKICQIKNRGKGYSKAQLVRQDQYDFYSKWYHSAIRSIIDMYDFKNDYKWLAKMVTPHITVKQAKQSVKLLEKLQIIIKDKNGFFHIADKCITTGKEVISLAIKNFHLECTKLAEKAIQEKAGDNKNITGLTLGISADTYKHICNEILSFQEKIMEISNSDNKADMVYQLNFQFFPLTRKDGERIKK